MYRLRCLGASILDVGLVDGSGSSPYGAAMAAKEALTRGLSAKVARHGIRVVGLRPQAMPATRTIRNAFEPRAKSLSVTWEQWQQLLASRTHSKR